MDTLTVLTLPCTKCGAEKPDEDFGKNRQTPGRRYRHSWCRVCTRAKGRDAYYRKRSTDNDALVLQQADARLRTRYGITLIEFEGMVAQQEHRCALCDHFVERLCVDHDHATGAVRGLLCVGCNAGLGYIEKPEWLGRALSYLDRA